MAPGVTAAERIPRGHKVALRDLRDGAVVLKFGLPIGAASARIEAGAHVHTHNLAFRASTAPASRRNSQPAQPAARGATFDGYVRADGRVGTRNVLLVLATVNCSATVARRIAERFRATVDLAGASVDGVVALTHQHGCSVRADGPGMDLLRRTLAGYASHPNVAGVLVIGLGCEDNQVDEFPGRLGVDGVGASRRSDHPGRGRHQRDRRRRGRRVGRHAACGRGGAAHAGAGARICGSGCNAAAPTGFRPSRPIRRWAVAADRLVAEGGTRHPFGNARKSTAPSSLLLDRDADPARSRPG